MIPQKNIFRVKKKKNPEWKVLEGSRSCHLSNLLEGIETCANQNYSICFIWFLSHLKVESELMSIVLSKIAMLLHATDCIHLTGFFFFFEEKSLYQLTNKNLTKNNEPWVWKKYVTFQEPLLRKVK